MSPASVPRVRHAGLGAEMGSGSEGMTSIKTDRHAGPAGAGALTASFGRKGALEVRLARSACEIDAAQAVRYRVFYEIGRAHV